MNKFKISVYQKIMLILILHSIMIVFSYSYIHEYIANEETNSKFKEDMLQIIKSKELLLETLLNRSSNILESISDSNIFNKYLEDEQKHRVSLIDTFIILNKNNKKFMQFRFIDKNGMEKIRIDRDYEGSKCKILENNKLQNKASRYYFQNSKSKKDNKIWFSDINLNMEQGKIEQPYKPTIRAIKPIIKNGEFKGILIINIFLKNLMKNLIEIPMFDPILVNQDGFTLLHYDNNKNWGILKENGYNIIKDYPINYKSILKEDILLNNKFISKRFNLPIQGGLILVLKVKQEYITYFQNKNFKATIINSLITLLLAIFVSIIIAKIFKKLLIDLDETKSINTKIEKIIEEEVKKSQDKDKLIFHQNKHISMGKMIENIAHQWRQPLAHINSTVYNMDSLINQSKIDKKAIHSKLDEIETVTDYLSQTIDDFKNFFNIKKEKSDFKIQDAIDKSISILKGTLQHHEIKIDINIEDDITIYGYSNELQQSILVILNNAKYILHERDISDPNISIVVKSIGNRCQILIEDNAGGVEDEILDKIFEPYFTTKTQSQGTGLGLYITKMIIEEGMKGRLKVENTKKGACFIIELERDNSSD